MGDRQRLRPTAEQYQSFADYLGEAHSWYKHLSLISGRRFVVFVAPDAGIGQLVAVPDDGNREIAMRYSLGTPPEGPEFTEEHPRLHYGWRTTTEYRRRFGYLDYMWQGEAGRPYDRDAGSTVCLPDEVEERCSFVLFPYVSGMFAEAVTWAIHERAIQQLRSGIAHPAREAVLELACLAAVLNDTWQALAEHDRDWIIANGHQLQDVPSDGIREYLDLAGSVDRVARFLHQQEFDKITRALAELDDWLLQG